VTDSSGTTRRGQMKQIQDPSAYLLELRAILNELIHITNSVHHIIPRILAAASVVVDPDPNSVRIDDIVKLVAGHFKVTSIDIYSQRRNHRVIKPRHVAMYLCRHMTTRSLPEIGRFFNNRDHSTVFHAVRSIEDEMTRDDGLARDVALLTQQISIGGAS